MIVTKTEKGWKIDLNRSTLPSINLDEEYINEMSEIKLDEKSNVFTSEKIGEAKWIKKAIEQRNKTILRVTSEILKKQIGFFKHGFSHMKPLILKDVADAIGMHESTVSRVTNSKLILTDLSKQPITRSSEITCPFFPRFSDISASKIFILFPLCLNQTPG